MIVSFISDLRFRAPMDVNFVSPSELFVGIAPGGDVDLNGPLPAALAVYCEYETQDLISARLRHTLSGIWGLAP